MKEEEDISAASSGSEVLAGGRHDELRSEAPSSDIDHSEMEVTTDAETSRVSQPTVARVQFVPVVKTTNEELPQAEIPLAGVVVGPPAIASEAVDEVKVDVAKTEESQEDLP